MPRSSASRQATIGVQHDYRADIAGVNTTDLSRNLRAKGGASGNLARTPSSISAYETLGPMCSSRVSSPSVHLA